MLLDVGPPPLKVMLVSFEHPDRRPLGSEGEEEKEEERHDDDTAPLPPQLLLPPLHLPPPPNTLKSTDVKLIHSERK